MRYTGRLADLLAILSANFILICLPSAVLSTEPLSYPRLIVQDDSVSPVQYAQAGCEPCRNCPIQGVDCANNAGPGEPRWPNHGPIPWQSLAHGEYVGPPRISHVPEYRLRVDDSVTFVYRLTREEISRPYELNVGDEVRVESLADENLDRQVAVQPDGTLTLRLIGQIRAAGRSVKEVQDELEERYTKFFRTPAITVTPIKVNTVLDDLRNTVDNRGGQGGQSVTVVVSPDGTIQLPAVSPIYVQGMTLSEVKFEVDARYRSITEGIEATPILSQRAPRFVYVLGNVTQPGRCNLVGPTTVLQALALAQGTVNGGNLRQIVVFRRADDWRLMATLIDLRGAILGKRPIPADEIWLRDSDIVLVPSTPIKRAGDIMEQVFTLGVDRLIPGGTALGLLELGIVQ